jgi:hypothetical protein
MSTSDAARQRAYRQRVAESGRARLSVVVSATAADRLHALAELRAESPGRALEHVLDVAVSAPLSSRKQDRMDRRITEVMAVVEAGERHIGNTDARARRRTARALGAAR